MAQLMEWPVRALVGDELRYQKRPGNAMRTGGGNWRLLLIQSQGIIWLPERQHKVVRSEPIVSMTLSDSQYQPHT
ncbi:hypothetical protein PM02_19455 [Sulfitobacter mediterraneus]|uniref:Uncharacterized protein n=1 Tax=Sulfitobacter mediterraneus TaxID=83219 RepID=A0A061SKM8_9RHOB|nr:hypothetical protein PM02_19455 [Sulfitobacter mediterraneus]